MKMKKTLGTIIMMGMLTLTSVSAFADNVTTDATTKESKITIPENIKDLKESIEEVNENMRPVIESIKEIRATMKDEFKSEAGEIKEKVEAKKETNKELREEYSLIKENFESLKANLTEQAKEAKDAGDTERLKEIKAEIEAAITEFKAIRDDFLSKLVNIEDEILELENLKEEYQEIKDEVLPYGEAIRERHEQVVILREQAKTAFSNQDFDTLAELLTQILELKEANYSDMLIILSLIQ